MSRYDVVVVGAGPAGAIAALETARAGHKVVLVERAAWPRVKPCAGGLSPSALGELDALGLRPHVEPHTLRMHTLRLVGPTGRATVLRTDLSAQTLHRAKLDALLVEAAVQAGAELRDRTVVSALRWREGRVTGVETAAGPLDARWVLVATGATGRLVPRPPHTRVLETCMGWYEGLPFEPDRVEMLFTAELSPHYGWLFPESDTQVNVGLCIDRRRRRGSIRALFARFLDEQLGARMSRARPVRPWRGHPIVTTRWPSPPSMPGCLLLGEAAALVNPFTGEGISYAMRSGRQAAEVVVRCPSTQDEGLWQRRYRRMLRSGAGWRLLAGDALCHVGSLPMIAATRLGSSRHAAALTGGALRPSL